MKTLQPETIHSSRRRGYRFWIGCLVLGLGLMAYYAYCSGVWGRTSLLLQYLFQCNCPVASEQARYPAGVEVVVSACKYHSSILSRGGRLLYVREDDRSVSTYLLDLQTNEKIPFSMPKGSNYFLTDYLIFHSFYGDNEYVLDIATGRQYPVHRFASLCPDAYVNGELNLNILVEELQKMKDVFLIDDDIIVALATDFHIHPERNFSILRGDFPGREASRAENFLKQNNITYHYVSDLFPAISVSPDGRFIARADGIYLIETDKKIVEGYSVSGYHPYSGRYFSVRGWTYDSSGVLYSPFLKPCLLETGFFIFEYPGCFIQVPQPLIKLKVPEEYLVAPTP